MISEAKLAANRRNAAKSTGPKSATGKALAKYNAVRHGALTAAPLVPGEDAAAWESHRAGVAASLGPAGALEAALADRVALALWRLARLARAEALTAAADIADAVLPNPAKETFAAGGMERLAGAVDAARRAARAARRRSRAA